MSASVGGSAGVASGHRLATEAGIEALRAGGTAVDAALAALDSDDVEGAEALAAELDEPAGDPVAGDPVAGDR